ncbi:hypothetical protein [Streptomyces sp. NBRC 109706]|uniref:SCO2584 family spore wall biosynthesis protein n=1 Tax=Streptomyces sp. NBRC 109706 TaxID=1550035 RepID=UPI000783FF61|nr:hypothetical protein [Streptomyces sp. NBRC 109706]
MPDDVGGPPFPDGDGPDSQNSGAAEEAFAAVVLDEAFVASAKIHEPSAAERMRRAGVDAAEPSDAERADDGFDDDGFDDGFGDDELSEGEFPEGVDEGVSFYRDPDLDPGGLEALDGLPVRGSTDVDGLDASDPLGGLDGLDALGGLDDADDEGRFDRSDYTRYLPGDADSPPDPLAPGRRPDGPASGGGAGAPRPRPARAPGGRRRPALTWQRSVACLLAMMMSLSVIALTLIAIQRAGGSRDPSPAPPLPAGTTEGLAGDPGEPEDVSGRTVADAGLADTEALGEGP